MRAKQFYFLVLMLVGYLCPSMALADKPTMVYEKKIDNNGHTVYSVRESTSMCKASITIFRPSYSELSFSLTYGIFFGAENKCTQPKIIETDEIAGLISDVIQYFQLESEIQSKSFLEVSVYWGKFYHAPLMRSINNNAEWPENIIDFLTTKYGNHDESFSVYRETLAKEVMKSDVYLPFITTMEELGCLAKLESPSFLDPFSFTKHYRTKTNLEKRGLQIMLGEALHKEVYPAIISSVSFELNCDDEGGEIKGKRGR